MHSFFSPLFLVFPRSAIKAGWNEGSKVPPHNKKATVENGKRILNQHVLGEKSAFIWKSEMEFEITNNVSGTGADWATRLFHWPHNQSHVWTDSLSKLSLVVLLSENLEKLWVAPGVSLNLKKTVSHCQCPFFSWLDEIITMRQRDFYKWMQMI